MAIATIDEVEVRNELRPGDIGYLIHMHGEIYAREYGFDLSFERYVAEGLCEFLVRFNADTDGVWICEHGSRIIGSVVVMSRGDSAQLRYFLIDPEYRGIGLGTKLIAEAISFIRERRYKSVYLWTVDRLKAAAHIYAAAGFELAEEKSSDAFGVPVLERRYELTIKG